MRLTKDCLTTFTLKKCFPQVFFLAVIFVCRYFVLAVIFFAGIFFGSDFFRRTLFLAGIFSQVIFCRYFVGRDIVGRDSVCQSFILPRKFVEIKDRFHRIPQLTKPKLNYQVSRITLTICGSL